MSKENVSEMNMPSLFKEGTPVTDIAQALFNAGFRLYRGDTYEPDALDPAYNEYELFCKDGYQILVNPAYNQAIGDPDVGLSEPSRALLQFDSRDASDQLGLEQSQVKPVLFALSRLRDGDNWNEVETKQLPETLEALRKLMLQPGYYQRHPRANQVYEQLRFLGVALDAIPEDLIQRVGLEDYSKVQIDARYLEPKHDVYLETMELARASARSILWMNPDNRPDCRGIERQDGKELGEVVNIYTQHLQACFNKYPQLQEEVVKGELVGLNNLPRNYFGHWASWIYKCIPEETRMTMAKEVKKDSLSYHPASAWGDVYSLAWGAKLNLDVNSPDNTTYQSGNCLIRKVSLWGEGVNRFDVELPIPVLYVKGEMQEYVITDEEGILLLINHMTDKIGNLQESLRDVKSAIEEV